MTTADNIKTSMHVPRTKLRLSEELFSRAGREKGTDHSVPQGASESHCLHLSKLLQPRPRGLRCSCLP